MVRVGGGWDTLQNYLIKHDPGIDFQMPKESDLIPVGPKQQQQQQRSSSSNENHNNQQHPTYTIEKSEDGQLILNKDNNNTTQGLSKSQMRQLNRHEALQRFKKMVLKDFNVWIHIKSWLIRLTNTNRICEFVKDLL